MKKKECLFCGGTKMSNEHIVAQWLLKELGVYDKKLTMLHCSAVGLPVSKREHTYSALVNGLVCEKCNNEWMSNLESFWKPHIINLMNIENMAEEIDFIAENYSSFAKWIFKNAILLNSAVNYRKVVPNEHFKLLNNGEIPDKVFVEFAFTRDESIIKWYQSPVTFAIKSSDIKFDPTIGKESYNIVFQFKHLLTKVVYYPSEHSVFYEDNGAVILFPDFGLQKKINTFENLEDFHTNGVVHVYSKEL